MSIDPFLPQPTAEPQLRLFEPPAGVDSPAESSVDGDPPLSADLTLWEFYEAYVEPDVLYHAAQRHRQALRESLDYWKQFTGDPPLREITRRTIRRFTEGLQLLPGRRAGELLADNTVRKHCGHVQRVLNVAGPSKPQPGGELNVRLLEEVPYISRPAEVLNEVEDNFTLEELGKVLDACRVAIAPRISGIASSQWWRSLIVFDYNVGLRIGSLLKLRWEWFEQSGDQWWIRLPVRSTRERAIKGRQGKRFYVNAPAMAALDRIRLPSRDLVFPWPYSESYLHAMRRRILRATGLPKERQLGFHGVRKAFATEVSQINSIAAHKIVGHSSAKTTADHYVNKRVMTETLDVLLQPPSWHDPQMRLFD